MPLIKSQFYLVRQIQIFYKRNSFSIIDNLTYSYTGNRLTNIVDGVSGNEDVGDFRDAGTSTDYTYYANGSLKSDANKGISNIIYDTYLNKISQIQFTNGKTMRFFYDGTGKLLKRTITGGDTWQYANDLSYKNGKAYQINYLEGRLTNINGQWNKEFYYQDHLSSNRVVFRANANKLEKVQETDIDPWGFELSHSTNGNPKSNYKMQGYEKIDELGWINIGARMFDPVKVQWNVPDRFAAKYPNLSTFSAFAGNPILYNDINGDTITIQNDKEKFVYQPNQKYEGNNEFIASMINFLNEIYGSKSGKKVLNTLSTSSSSFDILNIKSNNKNSEASYINNKNGKGGTILAGNVSSFYKLGHELFHGYNSLFGMVGNTTENEVGAYLFEMKVLDDLNYGQTDFFGDNLYNKATENLILNGYISNDYIILNNRFKYSFHNKNGIYNNIEIKFNLNPKPPIADIFNNK